MLEAEVVEINRDIEYCEQCLRKYGEWFNSPLQYLRVRMRASSQRDPILSAYGPVLRAGAEADKEEQNEGDHPDDGELQQQPAGRQEARQVA